MWSGRRQSQTGFTLLELLVVIVIISILMTLATLTITTGDPVERLKTEATRLATLIKLVQDESMLNAHQYALAMDDTSYRFLIMQEQQWIPVTEDKLLRPRILPEEMTMELEIDQQSVLLESSITKIGEVDKVGEVSKFDSDATRKFKPQIFLLSSGEISPVCSIRFSIPGLDPSYLVQVTDNGSLKIEYQPS